MERITLRGPVLLLLMALAATLPATTPAANAQQVPIHVFSAGGAPVGSPTIRLQSTLGQPLAGQMGIRGFGSGSVAEVGFWYLGARPLIVSGLPPAAPARNWLGQNAPNPFNPMTTISFAVAESGPVRLRLFNVKGQRIADLVDGVLPAGEHSLEFRPTELSSGVYFYRLEMAGFVQTKRLLLLK